MKFKKGDKVKFTGRKPEMFDYEFNKKDVYTVLSYIGDDLYVADTTGEEMVYMSEDNFSKHDSSKDHKYKVGDKLIVTACDGKLGHHLYNIGTEVKVISLEYRASDDLLYYYCQETGTGDKGKYLGEGEWYLNEGEVKPAKREPLSSSTGKLKVQVASFTNKDGDEVSIKRSKCRHYYIKVPGEKQKRIHKYELSKVLTDLAANL